MEYLKQPELQNRHIIKTQALNVIIRIQGSDKATNEQAVLISLYITPLLSRV